MTPKSDQDDRELLEKAARAAGIEWSSAYRCYVSADGAPWRPLTDDGDCARLEAALGISIDWSIAGSVMAIIRSRTCIKRGARIENGDRNAARRLAAVRAAAAIAKETP